MYIKDTSRTADSVTELVTKGTLHYSCLENPTDRDDWRATVHRVTRVRHDLATNPPCHMNKHTEQTHETATYTG